MDEESKLIGLSQQDPAKVLAMKVSADRDSMNSWEWVHPAGIKRNRRSPGFYYTPTGSPGSWIYWPKCWWLNFKLRFL